MPSADRATALLGDLSALLEPLGVRWFLFGAQAAALYGNRRVTVDVDVTVELGDMPVTDFVDALSSGGFPAPRLRARRACSNHARLAGDPRGERHGA